MQKSLTIGLSILCLTACKPQNNSSLQKNLETLAYMQEETEKVRKEVDRLETILEETKKARGKVDEFTMTREEFLSFFSRLIHGLPDDARFELNSTESPRHHLSTITIQNLGPVIIYEQEWTPRSMKLTTVTTDEGKLDIVVDFFDEPILEDAHRNAKPIGSYPVLRNIWRFEWRVQDGRTREWIYNWDIEARIPWRMELNTVFHPDESECIYYFAVSIRTQYAPSKPVRVRRVPVKPDSP